MCGFKWVLTNRGTAEWAVWCRAKGEKKKRLTGAPPSGQRRKGRPKHTKLRLYLQCFCLSVASLSLQLAAPSDLDPGWGGEAEELSAQGLQLFALHKISGDLQIKSCCCVLGTQRCQCSQWLIFSSEREYSISSHHLRIDSHSFNPNRSERHLLEII